MAFLLLQSFEHVLANINKLNRNLEAVITVGNEFSSVEALWSTFENVMGKDETVEDDNTEVNGRKSADGASEGGRHTDEADEVKVES